jgi:hypothetical protein
MLYPRLYTSVRDSQNEDAAANEYATTVFMLDAGFVQDFLSTSSVSALERYRDGKERSNFRQF